MSRAGRHPSGRLRNVVVTVLVFGGLCTCGVIATSSGPAVAEASSPQSHRRAQRDPPFTIHANFTGPFAAQMKLPGAPVRDDVVIFYRPALGLWPSVYKNKKTGKVKIINGGLPMLMPSVDRHLAAFADSVLKKIPDPSWSGYAVLDHEAWRVPWNLLQDRYKKLALKRTNGDVRAARELHQRTAVDLIVRTLELGAKLRPNAKWGFYAWPVGSDQRDYAILKPIYDRIDVLLPSAYWHKGWTKSRYERIVRKRLEVARQIANGRPILVYTWWRLVGTRALLSRDQYKLTVSLAAELANGVVVWSGLRSAGEVRQNSAFWSNIAAPILRETLVKTRSIPPTRRRRR